jgi:hypothetical protein
MLFDVFRMTHAILNTLLKGRQIKANSDSPNSSNVMDHEIPKMYVRPAIKTKCGARPL